MRRLTTLFALLLAFAACEKANPSSDPQSEIYSGPFSATIASADSSDLCKDYEITSFYYHKERNDPERYLPMIQALRKLYGKDCTIGEAINKSAHNMGITDQEIQELRDLMLE